MKAVFWDIIREITAGLGISAVYVRYQHLLLRQWF